MVVHTNNYCGITLLWDASHMQSCDACPVYVVVFSLAYKTFLWLPVQTAGAPAVLSSDAYNYQ